MNTWTYIGPLRLSERADTTGEGHFRAGAAHLKQGRCVEAAQFLTKAAEQLPDRAEVWTQLGVAMVGIDQSVQARVCFERSLSIVPNQPEVWNNLGIILLHSANYDRALEAFNRALSLQPKLVSAQRNTCLALFALGRNAEAEAVLPVSADRCILQGQALVGRGELESATESYREAIRWWEQGPVPTVETPGIRFPLEGARRALIAAKDCLDAAGIPFCLLAGTLLGVVREGDLLPHDKDLDLAMGWEVDRGLVVRTLCAGGLFSVPWFWGILPPDRPWYRSFTHAESGCTLDIFFLCPDGDRFLCGFDHRPIPVLSRLRSFGLRDWRWMERLWQVPDPPEQYLQEVYGSNWMVPDPGYDTILSNPARTAESLPLALCLSYVRVFEALQEGKLARASALVAQILSRTEDPFLADLRTRIDRRFGSKAPRTGSDG